METGRILDMTNGGGWARQGWGIVIVVGTAVALLPWFGFGLHTIVVADSCTEASETYQRLSMVPTVIAVGLPIAFVLSLRKRSPVAYIVVAVLAHRAGRVRDLGPLARCHRAL